MKKILIVMDDINYRGGAHFATFNIANYLCLVGNRVDIFTPVEINADTIEYLSEKIKILKEEYYKGYDYIVVPFENSIYREKISKIKDVIKIQWIHIDFARWKDVVGLDIDKEKVIFEKFDKLVFVSEHSKLGFLRYYPEMSYKTFVIYNFLNKEEILLKSEWGIDDELMKKDDPDMLNIVVAGRLEPQKAYHRLIDIVKILNEKNLKTQWFVLGKGDEYTALKERCIKYNLKNIHFLGYKDNPYPYIKRADLFAIISEYEGLALVIAESLTLKVPVITTDTGAPREILKDEHGWIVENDIYSIINVLSDIVMKREKLVEKKESLDTYFYDNSKTGRKIMEIFGDTYKEDYKTKLDSYKLEHCPIVSIIVPVYNMELYLAECLDSLVNQTLENIEIIIVNDGSIDKSIDIIEDYAYRYSDKIRYFNIANSGLGKARNYGISKARAQLLGFVDSDDFVRNDMFEVLYNATLQYNADCVLSDYIAVWEDGRSEYVSSLIEKEPDRFEILKYSTKYGVVNACTKLIHRSLFNDVLFTEGFYEDLATMPILLSYAKKIHYVKEGLYYYRQRSGSITSIKSGDSRLLDCYKAWNRIKEKSNPLYKNEIAFSIYWSMNFFCTDFLDDFTMYSKNYYDENENYFINNKSIEEKIKDKIFVDLKNIIPIPKIIHFCWFGNNEKNKLIEACMESWRKFAPDFTIMEWNENNCDIQENNYVKKAYEEKKWAFVSDYFRLKALYEYGGVYLDTDMELMKPLEPYLYNEAFFAFETPIFVHAGIIGAKKENRLIGEVLKSYEEDEFIIWQNDIAKPIPWRITEVLEKETRIVKNGKTQLLENGIRVYSANIMTIDFHDGKCTANHHYEGNWLSGRKDSSYNYSYEVMRHYFTWDLLHRADQQHINRAVYSADINEEYYKILYNQIVSSTSWKITKPIRLIMDNLRKIMSRRN